MAFSSDEENPLPTVIETYQRITGKDPRTVGRVVGNDLVVACVSAANHKHGDSNASLRINEGKDTWRCDPCAAQGVPGGRSTHLVVHAGMAKNLTDASKFLAPREEVEKHRPPPMEKQRLVAEYDYTAANGLVLYQSRRFEWDIEVEPGMPPKVGKTFSQRRLLDDGKWDSRLGDVERVPFHFPQMIYNCVELGKTLYVVEGEKDVLTLEAHGLVATTNAGGAGWGWTPEFIECFRGVTNIVVIGDNDEPGRATARARAEALSLVCGMVRLVESIPGVAHKGDSTDWFHDHPGATSTDFRRAIASVAKVVGVEIDDGSVTPMSIDVLHQRVLSTMNVIIPSVPFSIPFFDNRVGGMQQCRISVLAGRPGMGKTSIALIMAMLASRGFKVLVCSLEMGQLQWHDRMGGIRNNCSPLQYRTDGRPSLEGDTEWYQSHNMLITGGGKDATIERIDQLAQIYQPDLIVVDHLRHIKGWMGSSKARADLGPSEIMYAFPDIAKKRKTHFLLLHQLNRQATDEPALSDLRDAGAVEEAADNVLLIHRPFKTVHGQRAEDGSQRDDIMHVHLAKSREGEELHTHLVWQGRTMSVRPIDPASETEQELYTRCCPPH
jgi:hypothetical protein